MCEDTLNIFKKLLISSTILSFASPVISQVNINQKLNPSKDKKILEREILIAENEFAVENNTLKITVTGSRTPRPVDTFPGSIEVINMEDLDNSTGLTLRELTDSIQAVTTQANKTSGLRGNPNNGDNLNIRGMDKDRVLYQVDGIRLHSYNYGSVDSTSTRSSNDNSSFYYTMNPGSYINFDTLKTIEIIKGPASALYGSDAIGGVISFESLEADDLLGNDEDFKFEIPANYNSSNRGFNGSTKIATKLSDNTSALFIFTTEKSEESAVKTERKYLDNENSSGNNYFINITQKIADSGKFNLIYENIDRDLEITSKSDNLALMNDINLKNNGTESFQSIFTDTKTYKSRVSLNYEYESKNESNFIDSIKIKAYNQYSKVDDDSKINWTMVVPDITAFPGGPVVQAGFTNVYQDQNDYYMKADIYGGDIQAQSNIEFSGTNHLITYGIDYSKTDTSRLRKKNRTYTSTFSGPAVIPQNKIEKDTPDSDITRTGFYLQDEFSSGKFDFIAGLRYDNYDLDAKADSIYLNSGNQREDRNDPDVPLTDAYAADLSESSWSPKFAATYKFNDKVSAYGSYARGFRAPAYYEVNSSFYNYTSYYITESNPKLKPETSDSYEFGIRRISDNAEIKVAAFYNKYNDFIEQLKIVSSSAASPSDPTLVDTYKSVNINSAETKGIEFSSDYFFNEDRTGLNISSGITYQEGNNLTDNIPLTTINPFEAKIALGFKSENEKWNTKLLNTFVGKPRTKKNETNFIPNAYSVTDLITSYTPNDKFAFSLGIYNLFDTTYYNYQDVKDRTPSVANLSRYSQPGTFIKAGFKIKF